MNGFWGFFGITQRNLRGRNPHHLGDKRDDGQNRRQPFAVLQLEGIHHGDVVSIAHGLREKQPTFKRTTRQKSAKNVMTVESNE